MATSGQLERVAALVRRLTPLVDVERGEPIRAEDWNVVVSAIMELARAMLGAGEAGGVPPHDHADEVKVGWLAPPLRAIIERGTLADPARTTKLIDVDRTLGRLTGRLDGLDQAVTLVRDRVAEVTTRDLTRAREVTDVRRIVDGLADGRDDVAELRTTLDTLRNDLLTATDAARRLVVNGQVVDLPALFARIASLEAARDRLRLPNGETLDALTLEQRFADLVNTLVTEAELKAALDARPAGLSAEERAALEQMLAGVARREVTAAMADVVASLRAELERRLGGIDDVVGSAVAVALPAALDSALATTVGPEIAAAVKAGNDAVTLELERKLDEALATLRKELGEKLKDLLGSLQRIVQTEVAVALGNALEELKTTLGAIEDRLTKLEQRVAALESTMSALTKYLTNSFREVVVERTLLEQRLLAEMQKRDEAMEKRLDGRLDRIEQALRDRIDTALGDRLAALKADLEAMAGTAASREINLLATRIRGEMHEVARDEVAAVDARFRRMLDERLTLR